MDLAKGGDMPEDETNQLRRDLLWMTEQVAGGNAKAFAKYLDFRDWS
jgi:hypothetical protein